jgi:hypothetical protein
MRPGFERRWVGEAGLLRVHVSNHFVYARYFEVYPEANKKTASQLKPGTICEQAETGYKPRAKSEVFVDVYYSRVGLSKDQIRFYNPRNYGCNHQS